MARPTTDTGYNGRMVSLAGVLGREGLGLIIETETPGVGTGSVVQVKPANPLRVWMLIRSAVTNTSNFTLYFGDASAGHIFAPGDSMLINKDMPWTGSISISDTALQMCEITEARIQQ